MRRVHRRSRDCAACPACSARDSAGLRPRSRRSRARVLHSRASVVSGATSRAGPSQSTRGIPRSGKAPSRSSTTSNAAVAIGDRGHKLEGHGRTVLVDLSEEMHGEVQCFRTRPADTRNPLTKLRLQPLRRCERRLGDGHGKEAPHPGGFAVAVGRGLGLAGDGLGLGEGHGLPPALVSDTWMSLAAQS